LVSQGNPGLRRGKENPSSKENLRGEGPDLHLIGIEKKKMYIFKDAKEEGGQESGRSVHRDQ